MKNKLLILLFPGIWCFLISGCTVKWTEAIQYGEVEQEEFRATVPIEIQKDLILVPVSIQGKSYRFLFDSGAPFSISDRLQREFGFKTVSRGTIVDSDHNRKKVNWVQVDAIDIGGISFREQTAFVGDFAANPILGCIGIDGIIGSNLIRHSNWIIDQEQGALSLFSTIDQEALNAYAIVLFETDYQYNIFLDVDLGSATVGKVLLDYGSNGSVSLSRDIFSRLKDRGIIRETLSEKGVRQTGIIGTSVPLDREIAFTDSLRMDRLQPEDVMLRTGKTVSIGNKLLSRFRVTIDWENQVLYMEPGGKTRDPARSRGFSLGYAVDKGIYVQSVIENSKADRAGIRPNMQVLKIDGLDFANGNDYCDYVQHELSDEFFIQLIDAQGQHLELRLENTVLK
ncbi:aspartyl protease family protein [Flavilitoribacter nigricans]|nr:aspartyl protease family protein [Flavilitoribacter nigricans]